MSDSSSNELNDLVGELYRAPLNEFVSRRNDLAKELRAAGDSDAAASVKALRKPSRPAWVLNQAVQSDPGTVEQLAGAVAEVLTTQSKGGDLRGALDGLRAAANNLAKAAVQAAAEADIKVDRSTLAQALLSVTADAESLDDLRAGCLAAIPPASALDLAANLPVSAPARAPAMRQGGDAKTASPHVEPAAPATDSQEIRAAEAALHDAEAAAQSTRQQLAEAEEQLRAATAAADAADAKRREAEREHQEAQLVLKDAQQQVKSARTADRDANNTVARARRSLQRQQRS